MLPIIECFPVQIPASFQPTDSEHDGVDQNSSGKKCPGQSGDFKPSWGGGMRAGRVRTQPDGTRKTLLHCAIDIMAAEGAEVRAIGPGKVARTWKPGANRIDPGAGWSDKGGNYVVLEQGGWRWYFAHLRDKPLVRPGDAIEAGQLLGYLGRTGNAVRKRRDGTRYGCPHLHLSLTATELRLRAVARSHGIEVIGNKADPAPLLKPLFDAGGWRSGSST